MPDTFGSKAYRFFTTLTLDHRLPKGVQVMDPYRRADVRERVREYFRRYFSDARKRVYVFGINPGRFGAGITGITFTDPVALQEFCGIANDWPKRRESSSVFVYEFINRWGGVKTFNRDFFLTATCPLGFVKDGVNYNFYDHPDLLRDIRPFLVSSLRRQLSFGARQTAIVLGTGKLKKVFDELNATCGCFERVVALEHPRFIMQYRRRRIEEYLEKYRATFSAALNG